MSKYRVIVLPGAEEDIVAIYQWIGGRSQDGATRWHRKLDESIRRLGNEADRYPEAPESHRFSETIRNLTFRMRSGRVYRLLFTIAGTEVHLLFVRGPGQDLATP